MCVGDSLALLNLNTAFRSSGVQNYFYNAHVVEMTDIEEIPLTFVKRLFTCFPKK